MWYKLNCMQSTTYFTVSRKLCKSSSTLLTLVGPTGGGLARPPLGFSEIIFLFELYETHASVYP